MSENTNRLEVVRNTLSACRTNDPDEAAIYIELIDKVNELIHNRRGAKRIDQWLDDLKDCETQEEAEDNPIAPFNMNDLFQKLFPKDFS